MNLFTNVAFHRIQSSKILASWRCESLDTWTILSISVSDDASVNDMNSHPAGSLLELSRPSKLQRSNVQPLYDAARSFLEIPRRIKSLDTPVEVLQDVLQLLKESVSSKHAERLEQIVMR